MKNRLISQKYLDRILGGFAEEPEGFADEARALAREWNEFEFELKAPQSWRKPSALSGASRVFSNEDQFRAEIDSILRMDREEEACLARRVEFARYLLEDARKRLGGSAKDLEGAVTYHQSTFHEVRPECCAMPSAICRRWHDLHALRTELVERNLYLVLSHVKRYAHPVPFRMDLVQEGSAALFRAVDGFDWRRGFLFRTYAAYWLNQAFCSFLYNFGQPVRVPVYLQKAVKRVKAAIECLGDPYASPQAIAEVSGLGVNIVERALMAIRRTLSLDVPMEGEDESGGLAETLGYEEPEGLYSTEMEDISLQEGLHETLERLSARERFVVEKIFGLGYEREFTPAEVASDLGLSPQRVLQIRDGAIRKLRTPGLRKAMEPFL